MKIILILILLILAFCIGVVYGVTAALLATDPKLSLDLKPSVQDLRDNELYKKLAAKLDKK